MGSSAVFDDNKEDENMYFLFVDLFSYRSLLGSGLNAAIRSFQICILHSSPVDVLIQF